MIEIRGIDQLAKLTKDLEDLERTLFKQLGDAAEKGAAKFESAAKRSALELLPRKNGLAQIVANSAFTTRRGVSRLSIQASNKRGIRSINAGFVRHPVYGNRDRWVTQRVRKGWWDAPAATAKRAVESEMRTAMDRIAREFGR